MKPVLSGRWAETPSSQRREPTGPEVSGGFPCGPWDLALFNELIYRDTDVQREVANLLTGSGLTLAESDVQQLLRAVRSQRVNYIATVAGTANAITASLNPAPASLAEIAGAPIRIKIATTNTGAATLNLNSLGATAIVKADGNAVAARDLIAGAVVDLLFDGTSFQIANVIGGAATLLDTQIFSTPGAISWTAPADGLYEVTVIGGGGGGGGNNGTSQGASGGGGGGAAVGRFAYTKGQVVAGSVGAAGAGGAGGGGTGGTGGTTAFGGVISATGGGGGAASGNVGSTAVGTGGEINLSGPTPQVGGTTLFGGPGGHGPLGLGSGGNAGSGVQPGAGFGGGGSGAGPSTSLGGASGANGGIIIKRIR